MRIPSRSAIARGRDLDTFGAVDRQLGRKRRPTGQANHVEHLVSLLQADRRGSVLGDFAVAVAEARARGAVPPGVTDEQIDIARRRAAALLARWADLPTGQSLELPFPTPPAGT